MQKQLKTTETEAIKSELNEKWIKVRGLRRQNKNVLTNNISNTVTKKQLIGSILVSSPKKETKPCHKICIPLQEFVFWGVTWENVFV